MIREIVKYPDMVLARRASDVTLFDQELRRLVDDMFETMHAASGVGLAATQIGVSMQVFVMDCGGETGKAQKVALINPVIQSAEGEQTGSEGCLSVPGFSFEIVRPLGVTVTGQDVNGDPVRLEVTGLEARCVSHEVDHLQGKLLIARVSPLKRDLTVRKIRKRIKQGDW